MKISQGTTVGITFKMSFENGKEISSNDGEDPLTFVQGEHEVFSGVERALEGLEEGAETVVTLAPDQAYGPVRPESVFSVLVEQLPDDARETGAYVETEDTDGRVITGEVTAMVDGSATIDFNHPLAGHTIRFDIRVMSVSGGDQAIV